MWGGHIRGCSDKVSERSREGVSSFSGYSVGYWFLGASYWWMLLMVVCCSGSWRLRWPWCCVGVHIEIWTSKATVSWNGRGGRKGRRKPINISTMPSCPQQAAELVVGWLITTLGLPPTLLTQWKSTHPRFPHVYSPPPQPLALQL